MYSSNQNERELYRIYLGNWPHYRYYAGEHVTLKLKRDENMEIVITKTDIELGAPTETEEHVIYQFIMPERDVYLDYDYVQIYLTCPHCGKEYEKGENVCPHCQALFHEYAGEIKNWHDMVDDGVLAWGVQVGRFVFEKYGKVVYALTDTPHVGPSDVVVCYQLSRAEYDELLAMSESHRIPNPSVPSTLTDQYHTRFLCSQSAYAKRYDFTLQDVELELCDDL